MKKYAMTIVFKEDITNADARRYIKRVVKDAGGIVRTIIETGIGRLAYPIEGEEFANRIESTAMLPVGGAAKIDKALSKNQDALRYLIYLDKEVKERSEENVNF